MEAFPSAVKVGEGGSLAAVGGEERRGGSRGRWREGEIC
jgi:hypothetical protein